MLIGYARVSTSDQNAASQIEELKAAGCERIFTDTASGATADRPELRRLLSEIMRPGDTLVIWKLDRLGRSLKDLIDIVAALDGIGAGIRSLTDPIDTTSAQGRAMFQIFGAIAEFERALMLERTMAGLAAAKAQGRRGGRPKRLLTKDLSAIRSILSTKSLTIEEVAALNGVSRSTLIRRLKSAPAEGEESSTAGTSKKRRNPSN